MLEHRYYGDSQPYKGDDGWSYEHLKYLSAPQALADAAMFIKTYFEGKQVVVIGGSYPGALSAWFKSQYPDLAVASWSSSGVINAIENFSDFDLDIFITTLDSGDECSQRISEVTQNIDAIFLKGGKEEKE